MDNCCEFEQYKEFELESIRLFCAVMRILVRRDGLESDNVALATGIEFMMRGNEIMLFKDSDADPPARKAVPETGDF